VADSVTVAINGIQVVPGPAIPNPLNQAFDEAQKHGKLAALATVVHIDGSSIGILGKTKALDNNPKL
jgi:hypothetical protein